jgi:hypothetical protein
MNGKLLQRISVQHGQRLLRDPAFEVEYKSIVLLALNFRF